MVSRPLLRHLLRGTLGFGLVASVLLTPAVGLPALAGAPLGLLVLKGCPACWAARLVELLSQGRLERRCEDGRCTVAVPGTTGRRLPAGR